MTRAVINEYEFSFALEAQAYNHQGVKQSSIKHIAMIFFKILWGIDAVVAVVVLYFFFIGLADGSVGSSNGVLWDFIVLALIGIMIGSIWLRNNGHRGLANTLLLIVAVPAVLFALYFGLAIATGARWN